MDKASEGQILKPKIILIRNTVPEFYGGGETFQLTLSKVLAKNNFTPIIFSSSKKLLGVSQGQKILNQKSPFLRLQNWSGLRNLLLPFYLLWQKYLTFWYRRRFEIYRPAAIIVQSRDDFIAATLSAKKMRIPVFWLDHMDFRSWALQNVDKKYKNYIGKKILQIAKNVKKIIFISDYERNYFENLVSRTKIKKLKNLMTMKNGAIDRYTEFKTTKVTPQSLIYLGRLEEYKGIRELITGFLQISKKFPEAKLHIYGTGPLADFCQKYSNSQIIYHGFTDEPLKKIAESEIFILPSYIEGLSLALIDATMLGKAIITTNIDGNPEIVEDQKNGLLISAMDSNALTFAFEKLLSNPKLVKDFSHESRLKYLQEFDYEKTIREKLIPLLNKKGQTNE
mgnify:CR=1 FL=1